LQARARRGADRKLDLWLELGHVSALLNRPFLRTQKSRGRTRSAEFRRSSAHFGKGQWSMRLGWSPSTRAGLLGTGAMLPSPPMPHAPPTCPPRRRRPQNTGRRAGFGRNTFVGPPPRASFSVWGRLRACADLVGRGAPRSRVRPGRLDPSWSGRGLQDPGLNWGGTYTL
jgi:hypothetical protein